MIKIPYFLDGSRKSIVFHEYCKDHAFKIVKSENVLLDDDTENYVAYFKSDDYTSIRFASHFFGILGYGIFKTNISVIDSVLSGPGFPNSFLRQTMNSNYIMNSRHFMRTIYKQLNEPFNT